MVWSAASAEWKRFQPYVSDSLAAFSAMLPVSALAEDQVWASLVMSAVAQPSVLHAADLVSEDVAIFSRREGCLVQRVFLSAVPAAHTSQSRFSHDQEW